LVEVNRLIDIEGIGPVYAEKLKQAGAKTTKDLLKLAKTPEDRKKLADSTGIDEHLILKWANHADLMRIKGIGGEFAELLEKIGVDTVKELAVRNADKLYEAVEKFDLTTSPIVRRKPSKARIVGWIKQAKRLKPTLTYEEFPSPTSAPPVPTLLVPTLKFQAIWIACSACGAAIPGSSAYCDKCGEKQ